MAVEATRLSFFEYGPNPAAAAVSKAKYLGGGTHFDAFDLGKGTVMKIPHADVADDVVHDTISSITALRKHGAADIIAPVTAGANGRGTPNDTSTKSRGGGTKDKHLGSVSPGRPQCRWKSGKRRNR